jgi:hypothetical protein
VFSDFGRIFGPFLPLFFGCNLQLTPPLPQQSIVSVTRRPCCRRFHFCWTAAGRAGFRPNTTEAWFSDASSRCHAVLCPNLSSARSPCSSRQPRRSTRSVKRQPQGGRQWLLSMQGVMSVRGLVAALQTASTAVHSTWQASGRAVGLSEHEVVHLLRCYSTRCA